MPDDVETGGQPQLRRGVSKTGRMAEFGTAEEEVERICKNERNYYFVLHVKKDTPKAEIKTNYYKLSRLVHPDKCAHPKAGDAAAVLNQAWDTLNNPIKKRAYDAYVDDINVDAPEGMTYAEWEASNATQQIKLPRWVQAILRLPGGVIILALIMLPLTLILLALLLALTLICIPIQLVCNCLGCAPQPPPPGEGATAAGGADDATRASGGLTQEEMMAEMAARNAEARKAAGKPPAQQAPMGA
ncbi:hypothetical protein COHA_009120 [Chlorella ohadii]|uniref:J domain-containing protein n=1 Tax=Chlorella ohadii TaxID=2649997 RepID=A0AAD5DIN4_9CHLO|nr:hypothetical protein COHA_009120 [Chlorella ohadii]